MNRIYITDSDYQKLMELLSERRTDPSAVDADGFLRAELERAEIVATDEVPHDVVTMGSRVRFIDTETGVRSSYQLVFPEDTNIFAGKISVLSPVGTALLGYRERDLFEVELGSKVRKLRITEVVQEPRAAVHG